MDVQQGMYLRYLRGLFWQGRYSDFARLPCAQVLALARPAVVLRTDGAWSSIRPIIHVLPVPADALAAGSRVMAADPPSPKRRGWWVCWTQRVWQGVSLRALGTFGCLLRAQ